MNRTKFVIFSLVTIGLTFSYSVFALAVPDNIPHTLFVRMSLWSLTMLVLHALYSRLVNRKSLFLVYGIAIESKASLFILIVAIALAGLAILSAELKYNSWLTDKINTKPENDDSDTDFTDSHRLA